MQLITFSRRRPLLPLLSHQLVLAMRLTALLLLIGFMQVAASGSAQTISYSGKNVSIEKVFAAIKKQTSYVFFYRNDDIEKARKVTVHLKNVTLEQALEYVFKDQPLTYSIVDNTIVVKKKEDKSSASSAEALGQAGPPPPIDILGRITNEAGEPVIASVMIKGTQIGTTTNADGYFELKNVDDNATLVITGVSIESREVRVGGKTDLAITAITKVTSMTEVVINKGYYTEKQKFSVGNVGKVTAKDIENQPVTNPLLALQGRVPGLQITQTSGMQGSGVIVRIQGQNSLQNGNGPLYVIDGIPITTEIPTPGQTFGPLSNSGESFVRMGYNGRGNTLNYLNPSDIESIEVLKDADATSIYGSRAANGAILITTKKGTVGKTKVGIDIQRGVGQVAHFMDVLNTKQYLEMRREALKNDGLAASLVDPFAPDYAVDLLSWDTTRHTNWQKELIGRSAQYTNANVNLSGGTTSLQYRIGVNYHKETTVFPGDFSNDNVSGHLSLNNQDLNQRFHFQVSTSYFIDNNKLPAIDLTNTAIQLVPNAPSLYTASSTLNWEPDVNGLSTFINPLAPLFHQNYEAKTNNLVANTNLSYDVFPGLNIASNLGYTSLQSSDIRLNSVLAFSPEERLFPWNQSEAFYGDSKVETWIIEPQITYKKSFGKSRLDALVGSTFQETKKEAQTLTASGFNNDQVLRIPSAASKVTAQGYLKSLYKYNAIFSRLNYIWADKYVANFTGRYDGSSRFGSNNKFHSFWSVGGAWIISEESFLQNNHHSSFLSYAKLKGNYGSVGSDQIGDYRYLTLYNIYNTPVPYQETIGLSPLEIPNPHLQWEETRKLSIGIDLGFFNDRLLLISNYSKNKSSNQLLDYALPRMAGRSSVLRNFPATVQNSTWELSLNSQNIKGKNFSWSSSINLTIPRNKLLSFDGIESSSYSHLYVVGQPISLQKLYNYNGVDLSTGLYTVTDSHGNPTSSPNSQTDRTVLISNFSKYYGGIQNSLQYGKLELTFFIQFVKQTAPSTEFGFWFSAPGKFWSFNSSGNQPTSVLSRWQKPGDHTNVQKFTTSDFNVDEALSNLLSSEAYYSDASFARLKNISLSWEIPDVWKKKAHLQNCRFYIEGQNLFTITKYKGLDPETLSFSSIPPLRVLTAGLQIRL